jgi:hypothetical protein
MKKQKTDEVAAAAAPAAAAGGPAATAAPAAAGIGAAAAVVWAKGTGYGYGANRGAGNVWDPKAAAAAQEAQDEQLCGLLQGLAAALNDEMGAGTDPADTATAGQQSSPSAEAEAAAESDPMDVGLTPSQQECFAAVQGSVLLPLLVREFGQVAFPEMVLRHQYYQPLLSVLQALCRPATEQLLAANALGAVQQQQQQQQQGAGSSSSQQQQPVASIVAALRGLIKGATMYRERMAKTLQGHEKEAAKQASSSSAPPRVDKQTGEGAAQIVCVCTSMLYVVSQRVCSNLYCCMAQCCMHKDYRALCLLVAHATCECCCPYCSRRLHALMPSRHWKRYNTFESCLVGHSVVWLLQRRC